MAELPITSLYIITKLRNNLEDTINERLTAKWDPGSLFLQWIISSGYYKLVPKNYCCNQKNCLVLSPVQYALTVNFYNPKLWKRFLFESGPLKVSSTWLFREFSRHGRPWFIH